MPTPMGSGTAAAVAVAALVGVAAGAGFGWAGVIAVASGSVALGADRWRDEVACGSMAFSGKSTEAKKWVAAARIPRRKPSREEACDRRSRPQDVTSSWARRGGINLQQEVVPQRTERSPRDSPGRFS